jgi:anti-sigma regulatory factor (Ser/Thr protein kinase)
MISQQELEIILKRTGYQQAHIYFRCSAYDWVNHSENKYMRASDKILQKFFDANQRLSKRKEIEIKTTLYELMLNSCEACNERYDLFIEYRVYSRDRTIVIYVKDEGQGFDHQKEVRKRNSFMRKISNFEHFDKKILLGGEATPDKGTGLYCLLRFANDFRYIGKGNEIIAKFNF